MRQTILPITDSSIVTDFFLDHILEKVVHEVETKNTLKNLPQYSIESTLMQVHVLLKMDQRIHDMKGDDCFLEESIEPVR